MPIENERVRKLPTCATDWREIGDEVEMEREWTNQADSRGSEIRQLQQ
jgi:hypothetical protein